MQTRGRKPLRRASTYLVLAAAAGMLAACATPEPKATVHKKRSKEYFSESEYGVKASPYVGNRRLIGRDQIGKPYQVRGKWYYPKEDRKYAKVGTASWYGDAFHGRLTANGEVYNVTDITAAHPTMPLPSYARVTNLANGSSLIVRVNDRGPYHDGRLIDLSKRAADMLGYSAIGTARVKVEFVGRAPLAGHDEQYLVASYRPGNRAPDPSDGLPTGVMIAMDGSSPSRPAGVEAVPFPGQLRNPAPVAPMRPVMTADAELASFPVLPDFGPIVQPRPDADMPSQIPFSIASLSYADERVGQAAQAFAALDTTMTSGDVAQAWKRLNPGSAVSSDYVAAGSYPDAGAARAVADQLSAFGKVEIQRSSLDGREWYSVNLYPDGRGDLDDLLQAAWAHGAPDALAVRG
ncbi:MAG: septal ring lytic transglycosylase RlpA family protein [Mesorhizobium sp.]|nr:septal ring lytic transglycosylase RlpA family protein [Mesorhizobium sp.]